jgi:hypothetical protein
MDVNRNIVKTFQDPVIWCESYLRDPRNRENPLILRSYQREILNNLRILLPDGVVDVVSL